MFSPDAVESQYFKDAKKSKSKMQQKDSYVYNPCPIRKKSKKNTVPLSAKDARYWMLRIKNNMAAQKSREARRKKELEVVNEVRRLKNENNLLRQEVDQLKSLVPPFYCC